MQAKVPVSELNSRLLRFRQRMERSAPDWELAAFFGKINQYYFTGTMQDGLLLVPRDGDPVYWVRRSYDRALLESRFPDIREMQSFRDVAGAMGSYPKTCHIETEIVPIALLDRFKKHIPVTQFASLDTQIAYTRAEKSSYEIERMRRSGEIHRYVLEDRVPELLYSGMSEADLGCLLHTTLIEEGHHGIIRFSMFGNEIVLGQIAFGDHSIAPTYFNGPGGAVGLSPAVPLLGSRERKLRKGDLVFLDVGCGYEGYHTDKTMIYQFGSPLPDEALTAHEACLNLQEKAASLLRPHAIPADIYKLILESVEEEYLPNFMGFGRRRVPFIGHGVGLEVDEYPVIADGFTEPLAIGMTIALEPKIGIAGVGMVGGENTYLVGAGGGESITGTSPGLIEVGF
ncbi:MAG: aminopeptidase P family protein [Methanocalculus sp. MSAO_Arc1]|uniref:M24 family metallopeptidase n=1 Tax=Methanocalculus TaxID=71151 RepID=UPI000FF0BE4B|nr:MULTISPECIES: Xaa-Pro peptidase family protein [unclassified Methanocalculus]MCP1661656.1 Xaa-Pro aminopeptidase [Methanocalculus sp. AMF5]RQD81918.1 MAG: aminopeptidase P family protein [Methanocalculus sp. MSAO_Arc1]